MSLVTLPRTIRENERVFNVVSPVRVIQKLPRIPFEILVVNRFFVTEARVPSERAIASSKTPIA